VSGRMNWDRVHREDRAWRAARSAPTGSWQPGDSWKPHNPLELAFRSPSPQLKIELQGGEPLLNFPLVRWITAEAKKMNKEHGKDLAFVIATNLALLDDEILDFCAEEEIHISTSLDGPQDLHNSNRRRPGRDSWQQSSGGHQAGAGPAWPGQSQRADDHHGREP
jgi:hypothetical protein